MFICMDMFHVLSHLDEGHGNGQVCVILSFLCICLYVWICFMYCHTLMKGMAMDRCVSYYSSYVYVYMYGFFYVLLQFDEWRRDGQMSVMLLSLYVFTYGFFM
jgi:hypothetical protein